MKKTLAFLTIIISFYSYGTPANILSMYIGYLGTGSSSTVTSMNIPFQTVVSQNAAGTSPAVPAITPDGSKVYIPNFGDNTVGVIDTSTYTYTTLTNANFSGPLGVAVNPVAIGGIYYAYVANSANLKLSVINTSTNVVTNTVNLSSLPTPECVAFLPTGDFAFIGGGSGMIQIIKTSDLTKTSLTFSGASTVLFNSIAITPQTVGGVYLAFATCNDTKVYIANASTRTPYSTPSVNMGVSCSGVSISPTSDYAYVTGTNNTIMRINTTTLAVTTATNTHSTSYVNNPTGIAVTPDGTTAYFANQGTLPLHPPFIGILDIASFTVTGVISTNIGVNPYGIAIGYTSPLTAGQITGSLDLSNYQTSVTASATNNTGASVFMTLAAYQLNPSCLPPYSNCANWVADQTPIGTPQSLTLSPGGTQSFSISTTAFTGDIVQFDLYQTSGQVSLSQVNIPYIWNDKINITAADIRTY